jgi:hypothetical protein
MSEKTRHVVIAAIASIVLSATTVAAAVGPIHQTRDAASAVRA